MQLLLQRGAHFFLALLHLFWWLGTAGAEVRLLALDECASERLKFLVIHRPVPADHLALPAVDLLYIRSSLHRLYLA